MALRIIDRLSEDDPEDGRPGDDWGAGERLSAICFISFSWTWPAAAMEIANKKEAAKELWPWCKRTKGPCGSAAPGNSPCQRKLLPLHTCSGREKHAEKQKSPAVPGFLG